MLRPLALSVLLLSITPAFAFEGENLLAALPDGYKVGFQQKKGSAQITEMVPAGETVEAWTEMVTVQVFNGLKVTPDQFRDRMVKLWSGSCANSVAGPPTQATENGYPIAFWMMSCPLNKDSGKPEITWFKAIQGQDSFYVVQKAFKFDPSQGQIVQWTLYLKKVAVCDTRVKERACPAGLR
ncbi:MAG TPA: hypothetical protein VFW22_14180 [Pseudolabrys sp.]|jgi:hypothetical protein|nr:hypothetical protein [Pseudolabrys sp.]HEX5212869.1 hypothetical protein [Pseudolabrys sp.]